MADSKEQEIRDALLGQDGGNVNFIGTYFLGAPDKHLKPCLFIGAGIALVLLGLISLSYPIGLTLMSSVFLGLLLILGGIAELVQGFGHSGFLAGAHMRAMRWEAVLMGICLVFAGLVTVFQPVVGAILTTGFLGAMFLVGGIGRLLWAARHRMAVGWWGLVINALVSITLGVVLFLTLPYTGLIFIGLYIGIQMLFSGFSALFFGLSLRKWQKQHS